MRPCGSTVPRAARRRAPFPAFGALLACLLALLLLATPARASVPVTVLDVQDAIGPASADYIVRGIDKAAAAGAPLVVIRLDTPGGLDTAMRQIIQAILNAPLPVAVHVAPEGARAASAGTYILYAAHVAAMAPATTLGAATPVAIGIGGMRPPGPPAPEGKEGDADRPASPTAPTDASGAKAIHDAAAFIRGLAQLRGRNAEWAERAVREAVSLTADEALAEGVIDVVAEDVDELLARIDGRNVRVRDADRVLATAGLAHQLLPPDARQRLLAVIANPSFALVLMMIGIYGLIFEFSQPGFGVAGVTGAICLLLGLFALQMLPVNYAGLGLLLLGMLLLVAELHTPSFGVLGAGGVAAFIAGGVLLFDRTQPGLGVPLWLIVALAASTALFVLLGGSMVLRARRRPVVGGLDDLVGLDAEIVHVDAQHAFAQLRGENWEVRSASPLAPGQKVRVTGRDGLLLTVSVESNPPQARGEA